MQSYKQGKGHECLDDLWTHILSHCRCKEARAQLFIFANSIWCEEWPLGRDVPWWLDYPFIIRADLSRTAHRYRMGRCCCLDYTHSVDRGCLLHVFYKSALVLGTGQFHSWQVHHYMSLPVRYLDILRTFSVQFNFTKNYRFQQCVQVQGCLVTKWEREFLTITIHLVWALTQDRVSALLGSEWSRIEKTALNLACVTHSADQCLNHPATEFKSPSLGPDVIQAMKWGFVDGWDGQVKGLLPVGHSHWQIERKLDGYCVFCSWFSYRVCCWVPRFMTVYPFPKTDLES